MNHKVSVVDYGNGNLLNVVRALEHCGAEVSIAKTKKDIQHSGHLVLPGVGAFSNSMNALKDRNLITPIINHAIKGNPLLGICLGMQMLLDESEEFGSWTGLGLISGKVIAIPKFGENKIPHKTPVIGWNELQSPKNQHWKNTALSNIDENSSVYFIHSFMAQPQNQENQLAFYHYNGLKICAAIQKENMIGCQFHPEKSGHIGLKILNNFMS